MIADQDLPLVCDDDVSEEDLLGSTEIIHTGYVDILKVRATGATKLLHRWTGETYLDAGYPCGLPYCRARADS